MKFVALSALASAAAAEVLFQETFDETWTDRWVASTAKGAEQGEWKLSAGKLVVDPVKDLGIQTSQDAKFYGVSAKFKSFSNKDKDLVVQFSVKHEQGIDCGGGYLKIYSSDIDQDKLHGDSPYNIMFGPDICGSSKRVHVIFTYKGKNLLKKVDIPAKHDELTHLYTLILKPDNTYEVQVDLEKVSGGKLEEDWDFLPAKEIDDPTAVKPEDWDERATIPDPEDKKPENWDDIPEFVADPEAKKPEDWDDEDDGEWEAPQVPNPDFKGTWAPAMITNPAYKGKWVKPTIPNPEFTEDSNLYLYEDLAAVGFDLWQVKSGSIFDNVMITDSVEDAKKFAEETFKVTMAGEKVLKEEADKKAAEESAKAQELAQKLAEDAKEDKKDEAEAEINADEEDEEDEVEEEKKVEDEKPIKDEL